MKQHQIFILAFSFFTFTAIHSDYAHRDFTTRFEHQQNNSGFKEHNFSHRSTSDFSYDPHPTKIRISSHKLSQYTVHEFKNHFTARGYTENAILNQRCLYMFDEFVKFAQTYSGYKCTIQQLYAEIKNLNCFQKAYYIVKGTYCRGLQKRIHFLYNQLNTIKTVPPHNDNIPFISKTEFHQLTNQQALSIFRDQTAEYNTLESTYRTHTPSVSNAISKRLETYKGMSIADASRYTTQTYVLNDNVKQLLSTHGQDTNQFNRCFGNSLDHVIHQESIDILERVDRLLPDSLLYDHQGALVNFTVAMVAYNHEGLTDKASQIGDLCWTLLDFGQAVIEGAALGVYSAAQDILTNPIEATLCIVAGKEILAYQLCKVLYNVADISVTAITDWNQAKDKWDKYTQPLNNIIGAISTKEISLRDAVKGSATLVVGLYAQNKLLGGLSKFCTTIKQKSINFIQKSPLLKPQEYLATPEGLLLKATNDIKPAGKTNTAANVKNNIENEVSKAINQTSVAILKNGYYEVNGFKFTEYYYNYLWGNGRQAPSLSAKAILNNAITIIPDPKQIPGFFKYFAEGWEMIYNPTTKIVSHIQQIKNF